MKTTTLDFSAADWSALVWGEQITGHPADAGHRLEFTLPGEMESVPIADIPLSVDLECDDETNGGLKRFELDERATTGACRFLALAANNHASLVAAVRAAEEFLQIVLVYQADGALLNGAPKKVRDAFTDALCVAGGRCSEALERVRQSEES